MSMKRFQGSSEFHRTTPQQGRPQGTFVVMGNFDGVHIGHQALIKRCVEEARRQKYESAVYTFSPHPRKVLKEGMAKVPLLTTDDEKAELIEGLGVDNLVTEPFTESFLGIEAKQFVTEILIGRLRMKGIVFGHDFVFGHFGAGSGKMLEEMGRERGFEIIGIGPIALDKEIVSSSLIRGLLKNGDVEFANRCLGRPFQIRGEVVHGFDRGRKIGFPTANVFTLKEAIPKESVYICEVLCDGKRYPAVTDIGTSPTFQGVQRQIEAHILDFNRDIYGKHIEVSFLKRIRDEIKFPNVEALCQAIRDDIRLAREYFKSQA